MNKVYIILLLKSRLYCSRSDSIIILVLLFYSKFDSIFQIQFILKKFVWLICLSLNLLCRMCMSIKVFTPGESFGSIKIAEQFPRHRADIRRFQKRSRHYNWVIIVSEDSLYWKTFVIFRWYSDLSKLMTWKRCLKKLSNWVQFDAILRFDA